MNSCAILRDLGGRGPRDERPPAAPLSAALQATRDVIVDLSELTLRRLVGDRRPRRASPSACARRSRTLWLAGAQPHIRRLIESVGLDRLPAVRLAGPAPRTPEPRRRHGRTV